MRLFFRTQKNRPLGIGDWILAPFNVAPEAREGVYDDWRIRLGDELSMTPQVLAFARSELFAYRIFAPWRMAARVLTESGQVEPGALIVQRVFVGPLFIEMGVKVVEVFEDQRGHGFSVVTLEGHMERGRETFALRRVPQGWELRIEAWSGPGHPIALLGRPVVRWMQKRFTAEGLESFAAGCAVFSQRRESSPARAVLTSA